MEKGKIFVMEGATDGCGKSTQLALLKETLNNQGFSTVNHHFPSYGEYQGVPVERYLKGEFGLPSETSPYFINSLYGIDRAITWKKDLYKPYNEGSIILLDRYTTSSIIYQAALIEDIDERKRFIDWIIDFEYHKLGVKEPDLVVFLYAEFDTITNLRLKRKSNDGIKDDIHERDIEFMRKAYDNAVLCADYLNWDHVTCDKDGEFKPAEEIHQKVLTLVNKKLK